MPMWPAFAAPFVAVAMGALLRKWPSRPYWAAGCAATVVVSGRNVHRRSSESRAAVQLSGCDRRAFLCRTDASHVRNRTAHVNGSVYCPCDSPRADTVCTGVCRPAYSCRQHWSAFAVSGEMRATNQLEAEQGAAPDRGREAFPLDRRHCIAAASGELWRSAFPCEPLS
jgi:hypothetical protein